MCHRKPFRPMQVHQLQELDFLLKKQGNVYVVEHKLQIFQKTLPQGIFVPSSKAEIEGRYKTGNTKMFLCC